MEDKLRGQFFTGNYKGVIDSNAASKGVYPALLHYSSLIEIGQQTALSSAPSSLPLANLQLLNSHVNQGQLIASSIQPDQYNFHEFLKSISLINEGDFSQAIETTPQTSPEKAALVACAMLKLKHPEIAENTLKNALSKSEEDASLQFMMAITQILKGEYEEASSNISELSQKFGDSPLLLNASAICALEEGNYQEAEQDLNKALSLANEMGGKNMDISLKNMIACKRQAGEDFSIYEQQLAKINPNDSYFTTLQNASQLLDQLIS
ncbi:unnamed protein product [Blepharisma stoltei]|uniref:Coatomer subunit epsilon n=1 Tax=Blepharisma stoltei TaxID=1481888 RepID=A0AAU9K937_9CILI|nr:unnamed protein product [Blepharisma stoltei]